MGPNSTRGKIMGFKCRKHIQQQGGQTNGLRRTRRQGNGFTRQVYGFCRNYYYYCCCCVGGGVSGVIGLTKLPFPVAVHTQSQLRVRASRSRQGRHGSTRGNVRPGRLGSGKAVSRTGFPTAVSPGSRPSQSICFITAAVCPCALEFQSLRNKNKE